MFGGARIRQIFTKDFEFSLNIIDSMQDLTIQQVLVAIQNSTGTYSPIVISETGFQELIKRQIKLLEKPCLECVDKIYQELHKIAKESFEKTKKKHLRFSILVNQVESLTLNLLEENFKPTKNFIQELVKNELAYIDTDHPDFRSQDLMSFIGNVENFTSDKSTETSPQNGVTQDSPSKNLSPAPKEEKNGLAFSFFRKKKDSNGSFVSYISEKDFQQPKQGMFQPKFL